MKKTIIGNWKMFKTQADIKAFYTIFAKQIKNKKIDVNFGIAVPSIHLKYAKELFKEIKNVLILSQDAHYAKEGAFTGNISWYQLQDLKIKGSLVGHSERRQMFGDTDDIVNKKTLSLVENKMLAIVCIGETIDDYQNNKSIEVVLNQVQLALKNVAIEQMKNIILAYEPVWAIGTGKVPTSDEVDSLISKIRDLIKKLYDDKVAQSLTVLYGGSVNNKNIKDFFQKDNINGALVGSVSLDPNNYFSLLNWNGNL